MLWDMFCQMISKQWFELTCSWLINLGTNSHWINIGIKDQGLGKGYLVRETGFFQLEVECLQLSPVSDSRASSCYSGPTAIVLVMIFTFQVSVSAACLWWRGCWQNPYSVRRVIRRISARSPQKKTGGRRKKRKYGFCLRQVLLRVMRLTLTRLALSSWSSCFAFSHLVLIALTVQDQSSSLNTWCPAFITRSAKLC